MIGKDGVKRKKKKEKKEKESVTKPSNVFQKSTPALDYPQRHI